MLCNSNLPELMHTSVNALCKTTKSFEQLGIAEDFHWNVIASCCSHIQPHPENLGKIDTYSFAVGVLGKVFQEYCVTHKVDKQRLYEIPEKIASLSNANIKNYFQWIIKMQNILAKWYSKFQDGDYNFEDADIYDSKCQKIAVFAKGINAEYLVFSQTQIKEYKESYLKLQSELCLLLMKKINQRNW